MFFLFVYFFFFKQKTAYEMRISDWSSDVCSSDRDILDPFDEHRIRVAVDMRDDRAARGVARTGQTERNTRIDDGDDEAAQCGEAADTRVGKREGRADADIEHRRSEELRQEEECSSKGKSGWMLFN